MNFLTRHIIGISSALLAIGLAGCLTDGPNHTGGAFLQRQGYTLAEPPVTLHLRDIPMDTFWTVEAKANSVSPAAMVVGRWEGFESQGRMAFELRDTSMADSLADSSSLELLLTPYLRDGVPSRLIAPQLGDSVRLIVHSRVLSQPITQGADEYRAIANGWVSSFITSQDTLTTLHSFQKAVDTVSLNFSSYLAMTADTLVRGQDTTFALPLENLRLILSANQNHRQLVFLAIEAEDDSLAHMLRFHGLVTGDKERHWEPSLAMRRNAFTPKTLPSSKRVPLYGITSTQRAVSYKTRLTNADSLIAHGHEVNMHVYLNRDTLIQRIAASLGAPVPASNQRYSLEYYLPYAEISFNVRPTGIRIESGMPMMTELRSEIDSLLDWTPPGKPPTGIFQVAVDTTPSSLNLGLTDRVGAHNIQLTFTYMPSDTLFGPRLQASLEGLGEITDTLFLKKGKTVSHSWFHNLSFHVTDSLTFALVQVMFERRTSVDGLTNGLEPIFNRSPGSSDLSTNVRYNSHLFLDTTSEKASLRAPVALQRLLNRTDAAAVPGQGDLERHELILRFSQGIAIGGDTTASPIPTFAKAPLVTVGNKLLVDIFLYVHRLGDKVK